MYIVTFRMEYSSISWKLWLEHDKPKRKSRKGEKQGMGL